MTHLSRRDLLRATGVATGAALLPATLTGPATAAQAPTTGVFRHGSASGDPLPDGVLLWTRVTPTAASLPGSGVGPVVQVTYDVATDAAFASVARTGSVSTGPARDHTVKIDVRGLRPATTDLGDRRSSSGPSPE